MYVIKWCTWKVGAAGGILKSSITDYHNILTLLWDEGWYKWEKEDSLRWSDNTSIIERV